MLLVPTLIDSVTVRKKKISDQEMQFYTTISFAYLSSQTCIKLHIYPNVVIT